MKKLSAMSIVGSAAVAAVLLPSSAQAYIPPALEIPVTCGQQTTTGPTSIPVYTGQEVKLVFSPTGCDPIYWTVEPSNWNNASGWLATQSSFTILAADVPAQIGQQFDIDKTGTGDYEQIVLTDGGPAPEPPAPTPTQDSLPDTGSNVEAAWLGLGLLVAASGAFAIRRWARTAR